MREIQLRLAAEVSLERASRQPLRGDSSCRLYFFFGDTIQGRRRNRCPTTAWLRLTTSTGARNPTATHLGSSIGIETLCICRPRTQAAATSVSRERAGL